MIDYLSGHYLEFVSVFLTLWILHSSCTAQLFSAGRVSKHQVVHPNKKCTHSTHTIPWSELQQTKECVMSSLSSHLLALFVAFMWNEERVNREKAQSYTAAQH